MSKKEIPALDPVQLFSKVEELEKVLASVEEEIENNEEARNLFQQREDFLAKIDAEKKSIRDLLMNQNAPKLRYQGFRGNYSYSVPTHSLSATGEGNIEAFAPITTIDGYKLVRPALDMDAVKVAIEEGIITEDMLLDEGVVERKTRSGSIRYTIPKPKKTK